MGPASWILGGSQALWLLALVVAGLKRAVRPRVLVTSGLGLLISLVVTTTTTPTELGVMLGTGVAIGLSLATRHGVTFTWMPDTEYWPDENRPPLTENLLLAMTALYFCAAAALSVAR